MVYVLTPALRKHSPYKMVFLSLLDGEIVLSNCLNCFGNNNSNFPQQRPLCPATFRFFANLSIYHPQPIEISQYECFIIVLLLFAVLVNGSSTLQSFFIESSLGTFVRSSRAAAAANSEPKTPWDQRRDRPRNQQRLRIKRRSSSNSVSDSVNSKSVGDLSGASGDVIGGSAVEECLNKNVWMESFVYSDKYAMNWVMNEGDLVQINANALLNQSVYVTFRYVLI